MTNHCPICNKAGLPDYKAEQIICPQCNSDLKPFMVLNSLSSKKPIKSYLIIFLAVFLIGIAFAVVLTNQMAVSIKDSEKNESINRSYEDSLQNMLVGFQHQLDSISHVNQLQKEITIQYTVRNGDHLTGIAVMFFNDWRMFKQIAADNNIEEPYFLKAGQPINIRIAQP